MYSAAIRGHDSKDFLVQAISLDEVPKKLEASKKYAKFYSVRLWDHKGPLYFYIAKGHTDAPREVVGWYMNGRMHGGFTSKISETLKMLQRDGWMHTEELTKS